MATTRVLIVDDSVVMRKFLTGVLVSEPSIEVTGVAATGSIALQKIQQLEPDVVVLDVEMPGMSGLEVMRLLHVMRPHLRVIMCSALTERGAETTLRALANGAADYVAKPSTFGSLAAAFNEPNAEDLVGPFCAELIAKVRALGGRATTAAPQTRFAPPFATTIAPTTMTTATRTTMPTTRPPVSAIGIGASTGGPNALATLFQGMPRDLSVPLFVVQHMPPLFTKLLAERLAASSGHPVHEAVEGMRVEPGHVYIAPGDHHMTLLRDGVHVRVALNQEKAENSCRPAVDVLFRSLAQLYGPGVLAAVMTGMGHDGTNGARAIVAAGGAVIVQDAATSVIATMPQSVVAAGVASGEYPLERLASELAYRARVVPASLASPAQSPFRRMQA